MTGKVLRTINGKLIDTPDGLEPTVVEAAIRDRNELYGEHVHAFEPREPRDWWLITWPTEMVAVDAANEVFHFAVGMGLDFVEFPERIADAEWAPHVFNQEVVYDKVLRADGAYADAPAEPTGIRLGVWS